MASQGVINPLTDHVLKAAAELRAALATTREDLQPAQQEDFDRLLAAASALEELLNRAGDSRTLEHDMRNVLGAMRGYGELLLEDLGPSPAGLRAALERVLGTVGAASASPEERPKVAPKLGLSVELVGTILLVDDNADNRELLTRYLQRSGHDALVASSGPDALEFLKKHRVDVVLLDLIMPGMDGGEVLARIKADTSLRSIPVIVISGRQDMEGIIQCIEAGADDYLFKPFNPILLQARIKAGLERKRWHDTEEKYRKKLERSEKFIRATFGRYVSEEIVDSLLEAPEGLKLGGELREVTMLMSDIRQFSTICEKLSPDNVMRMLNNYLGVMSDIIIGHQGTIDEFIGDAILAIFGAPIQREDDADRAVQCALDMQQAMHAINRDNRNSGLPEISMGIGVNTGAVITGNIGSEKRSKYGVVGHHVNLTARIESQTAGGDILISDSTLEKLRQPVQLGRQQQTLVKGIAEPVTMHQVLENIARRNHAS